jgi:asparagine synthase (glutamine-hydrolysing)
MCGIAGWYRRSGRPVGRDVLANQCDRLVHRGPDDSGYLADGDFGFGSRRLSIIDVEHGHQPIFSPDGRYAIVCNGEIVNHPVLRKELEQGYSFRTQSDTETLLASYLRWGDDAWIRLEGMYAAAIWDRRERTLCLARDPLGIKPLFLTEQRGGIAFASEIPALRVLPDHEFGIDERGVHDFFRFGHVLGPRSIFSQVRQLEPGHVVHFPAEGAAVKRCFWRARLQTNHGLSEKQWIDETRERVLGTVKQHMLSDVPIGVFLSGGVDSGAVAAAMARASNTPFKLFTASFPGSQRDESAAAKAVADHLGHEHLVFPVEPKTAAEVIPAVQRSFDEPSAANSAVPLWYLSRAAAEHVKVVLCGEGGDELFMGYNRLRRANVMDQCAPMFRALGGLRFLDRLPTTRSRKWNYFLRNSKRFRDAALVGNGYERFFASVTIASPAVRARIYERGFWLRQDAPINISSLADEYFPEESRQPLSSLEEFMLGDLTVHMPASMLQRLDRASMAHSLEARVPFLSHSFVDWALTIPSDLKLKGGVGKYVLRKAVEPWLPQGALEGPKLGFKMPLSDWFLGGFSDFARDAWRSSGAAASGFLNSEGVESLFDEHRSGKSNHGRILYAIAMFSCWWSDNAQSYSKVA